MLFGARLAATYAQEPTAEQVVRQAWELAQKSGRYDFRSVVEQTTYPRPSITNGGAQPSVQNVALEGQLDAIEEELALTVWNDVSFNPDTGVAVRVQNGNAYSRRGQNEWQEVDGLTDLIVPGGDPLGFLAGLKNVTVGTTRTTPIADAAPTEGTATQYLFDLDGPAFATYMQAQLERQLREQGKLPPGMQLSMADAYRTMTGTGELWLNEAGLPIQMALDADFPAQGEQERVTVTITSTFFNYDMERLGLATTSFVESPLVWFAGRVSAAGAVRKPLLLSTMALSLFVIAAALLIIRYWQTQVFYRILACFLIVSMLFSPLLKDVHASNFFDEQQAQQEAAKAQREEAEAVSAAQRARHTSSWKPNEDAISQRQGSILSNRANNSHLLQTDGPDSDGDGIADEEELNYWETDPNNADSDGDGLPDGQEAYVVGTAPALKDSDGDGLADGLEVAGFASGDQHWYLDPMASDSNNDSVTDGLECTVWLEATANYDPNASCPDSDGDGVPDLFDEDNDGDGVVDREDMNPESHGDQIFDAHNPFSFRIDNLEIGRPVYVDLQFRPTDPSRLSFFNSVLDWPTGDTQGQLTRSLDTTWATTTIPELRSDAANAGNGDVRVIPVLEIVIPGAEGHYGNLPVNDTYSGQPRPAGVPAEAWLDTAKLEPYGLSVGDSGNPNAPYRDLLLYAPVVLDTDPETGMPVAFTAHIPYFPEQGTGGVVDWGNEHRLRLLWLVQMLGDQCIDPEDDLATCQREDALRVVNIYEDEWILTGMNVSEQHGVDLAILYEDPANDADLTLDDQLWLASWNLNNTFLRARDIDEDGVRDVRVDNLASQIEAWHDPASGPLYLQVKSYIGEFEHSDELHRVAMTDTVSILNTTFAGYETATAPTFLFVQEMTTRSQTLITASSSGNLYTVDFDPDTVVAETTANLVWRPYEFVPVAGSANEGGWTNADPAAYLERLEFFLGQKVFVESDGMSTGEVDAVQGQRIWAQMYYTALYQGMSYMVEADDQPLWVNNGDVDETIYDPSWPVAPFMGHAYIANLFYIAFGNFTKGTVSYLPAHLVSKFEYFQNFDALSEAFDEMFLSFDANPVQAAAFKASVTGIVMFVSGVLFAATVLLVAGLVAGDKQLVKISLMTLAAASVAMEAVHLVTFVRGVYVYSQVVKSGELLGTELLSIMYYQTTAAKVFSVVAFILTLALIWGVYFYQLYGPGFDSAISKNLALASAIAGSVVAAMTFAVQLLLFVISSATIVAIGTILLILFFIVEGILFLIGEKTLTQRLSELIARSIYDVDMVLSNFNSEGRLSYEITDISLVNEEKGITSNNAFHVTLGITNTITHRKQSNDDEARRSAFAYFIQKQRIERHHGLSGNSMHDAWTPVPDSRQLRYTTSIRTPEAIPFGPAGLNRSMSARYLTEAYALPYAGCWSFFGAGEFDCDWEYIKGSMHINFGSELVFDVLPDTIEAFMDVEEWGNGLFPVQKDWDNDGLLSEEQGGPDPDDRAVDADNDGLADLVEIANGTDPLNADSDGDGMSDAQEIIWGTDPNNVDTDGDQVYDYIEAIEGWLVPSGDGTALMRVWSNPFLADSDGDGLDDRQELLYSFHPGVPTDPSVISNFVQIEKLAVSETAIEPLMLLQFEEDYPATTFSDSLHGDRLWSCDNGAGACPLSGSAGRYRQGVTFDGVDDSLSGDFILDPAQGDFTAALWFRAESSASGYRALLRQDPGSGGSTISTMWLGISGGGQVFSDIPGPTLQGNTQVKDGRWHHAAFVREGNVNRLYVDGNLESTGSWGRPPTSNDGPLRIGRVHNGVYPFSGAIDDVAVFDRALSEADVENLMQGRFNFGDLLLQPGDAFTYQATVTNTLLTQGANGFMLAGTEPVTPALPTPDGVFHFDTTERIKRYVPVTGNSTSWSCMDNGACPAVAEGGGNRGDAVEFDGVDDALLMPTINVPEYYLSGLWDSFVVTFWLWVDELPPAGEITHIMDTSANLPGSLDIYLTHDGWIFFDVQDSTLTGTLISYATYGDIDELHDYYAGLVGQHAAHGEHVYENGQRLQQWVQYTFMYEQGQGPGSDSDGHLSSLFVDFGEAPLPGFFLSNALFYESVSLDHNGLRVGPGTVGNGAGPGQPFAGRLDEVKVYNGLNVLATGYEDLPYSEFLMDLRRGTMRFGIQPSFHLNFQAPDYEITYPNDVDDRVAATCEGGLVCLNEADSPFDGGLFLNYEGSSADAAFRLDPLPFAQGDYTLAGWFTTTNGDRPLLGALNASHSQSPIRLGLNAGAVEFSHDPGGSVTVASAPGYNDGKWHHFAAVRQGDESLLYLDGELAGSGAGGGPANELLTIMLGRWQNGYNKRYNGGLDEFIVIPAALDGPGVQALMNYRWPLVTVPTMINQFSLDANSAIVVNDTGRVAQEAPSSLHSFYQEVEAAIELQQGQIDIPIVDGHVGNLRIYAPFEEVPGDTLFENIAGPAEFSCKPATACPAAGVRGITGRAALFDGNNDYLVNESGEMLSFAGWVKADRGVIFDTRRVWAFPGIELDVGQLRVQTADADNNVASNHYTQPLVLPSSTWTHVAVTVNKDTNIVRLYVNGSEVASVTYSGNDPYTGQPTLGGNRKGGDYLNGYLDDFRAYDITLSADAVRALYESSAPVLVFDFDESDTAITFADHSPNGYTGFPTINTYFDETLGETVTTYSPLAGTDGQIGNTALFNGTGRIEIPSAPAVDALANSLTIMAWINPNSLGGSQKILAHGRQNSSDGIAFGIEAGFLTFTTWGGEHLVSTAAVRANVWQHVAVVFDSANNATFYVNGLAADTVSSSSAATTNSDDSLYIGGATPVGSNALAELFTGQLDELTVYGRELIPAELHSIYLREARWYRARAAARITVDADSPTIELITDYPYRQAGYTQLVVGTNDPTTYVALLDVGVRRAGESAFNWRGAAECADSARRGVVWCPALDSALMGAEGAYELQLRAVDAVGNETLSGIYNLYVDGTAPTTGSSYNGAWVEAEQLPDLDESWRITLNGTVGDPAIGAAAGSGVVDGSVMVSLLDSTGSILDGTAQQATVSGDVWTVDYIVGGTRPLGTYSVVVSAEDRAGNVASATVGTILLDVTPASADIDYWQLPTEAISQSLTLSGALSEQAYWGGMLATYHFEEAAGATTFYDSYIEQEHASCVNCPAVVPALFGQGLQFDGVDDIVHIPNLFNPISETFTISLWFNVAGDSAGQRVLVQQDNGSGVGRSLLYLGNDNVLRSNLGGGFRSAAAVSADAWHHVALTFDGTTANLYVDGRRDGSAILAPEAADGGLQLGSNRGGSAFFAGMMDEVTFYGSVLPDYAVHALAQSDVHGAGDVQVGFEVVDFAALAGTVTTTEPVITWYSATLGQQGDRLSTWSLAPETLPENYYTIKLKSDDVAGNESGVGTVWRGLIDQVPPQVVASGQHVGSGRATATEYTFTFSDFLLDLESSSQPCNEGDLVSLVYDDPVLPYDGLPYEVTATCRVPGHEPSRDFTACDGAGLCTTVTVTPEPPRQTIRQERGAKPNADAIETVDVPVGDAPVGDAPVGDSSIELSP